MSEIFFNDKNNAIAMSKTTTITVYDFTCGNCTRYYIRSWYYEHCAKCNTNLCWRCDRTTLCESCTNSLSPHKKKSVKAVIRRTKLLALWVAFASGSLIVVGVLPWGTGYLVTWQIILIIFSAILLGFFTPMLHFFLLKIVLRKRLNKYLTK